MFEIVRYIKDYEDPDVEVLGSWSEVISYMKDEEKETPKDKAFHHRYKYVITGDLFLEGE